MLFDLDNFFNDIVFNMDFNGQIRVITKMYTTKNDSINIFMGKIEKKFTCIFFQASKTNFQRSTAKLSLYKTLLVSIWFDFLVYIYFTPQLYNYPVYCISDYQGGRNRMTVTSWEICYSVCAPSRNSARISIVNFCKSQTHCCLY